MKKLEDYLKYEQPTKYIVKTEKYNDEYKTPVLTAGKTFILGYTNETENIFPIDKLPVIIFDDFTTDCKYVDFPFKVKSSAMKILHPINKANAKFLYYFMKNIKFDNKLHKRYWISQYSKLEINELDQNEQNEFVEKMEKIENAINIKVSQIEKYNNLIKSQFVEMFGDPFKNEKKYKFITFDNFMDRCVDIGSNGANSVISEHLNMKDKEDYAMLIRTINFTANDFENNMKYIDKEAYEFFSKSKVFGGEIVFNKIGSAGINFIVPNFDRPVSLGLNQIMVTPKDINTRFLYELLNTEYGKCQINSRVKGAVTKSIQKTELKKIPIMYPPIEFQNKFAQIVEQIDKQKSELEKSIKKLEELQVSLMQEYFG